MLGAGWTQVVALSAAFAIAVLATPAGVSGAVLLLPFQVSVLGTPSPAVTPTNLLYNVVATPGARVFDFVVAAVLLPLGSWLAATKPAPASPPGGTRREIPRPVLVALAAVVGCVGGIYGIGGGSVLAPVLIGSGRPPSEVAPAALASTFVTSVAGVVTFTILSVHEHGSVAPDWPTGIALGAGGLAGAYLGARLQSRLPDLVIRRVVGVLVVVVGARYLWAGLG
jgi:uncharacterized membrane protein YfcA